MIRLTQMLEQFKEELENGSTRSQFIEAIDVATAALQKAIDVSKFEFAYSKDTEHFESQISSLIEQIDEMYAWADGKMKPE